MELCVQRYMKNLKFDGTIKTKIIAEKDGWDNSCIILGECND